MNLVTWNCCRGAYAAKVPLLAPLGADVAVVPECARPLAESETCLWFGDNPRQGLAVTASNGYRLSRLPAKARIPKYVVPVQVTGPESFTLLAVWSKANQRYRYVTAVIKALQRYRALFTGSPVVVMGDLNTNLFWDSHHPAGENHSALMDLMEDLGLVSAYHHFFGEAQGCETRPTCYLLWKRERPYHLDYCFVPRSWASRIRRVDVGSYEEWQRHSDHRPLLVELSPPPGT
jgi:hypothetical protein